MLRVPPPVPQFQQAAAPDVLKTILQQIKNADVAALYQLLEPFFEVKSGKLVITDLGCGEGLFLLTFLKFLSEHLAHYKDLDIEIRASEPNQDLREQFRTNLTGHEDGPYLSNVNLVDLQDRRTEDYEFGSGVSDLVILSHSLYYLQRCWNSEHFADIPPANNIFTTLVSYLRPQGRVCVILQSDALATRINRRGTFFGTNEQLEREVTRGILQANPDNVTTAEIFKWCLNEYDTHHHEGDLHIREAQSIAPINIGVVNFDEAGVEGQTPEALGFLNFYTRGRYATLATHEQEAVLRFLKHRCQRAGNEEVEVHHVNKSVVFGR